MDDSIRRQLARRAVREWKAEVASQRERELADPGERVEIALRTRDATVRIERVAGELLSVLTRKHRLSMEEALLWCGGVITRTEGLRLRREHEREPAEPVPDGSSTVGQDAPHARDDPRGARRPPRDRPGQARSRRQVRAADAVVLTHRPRADGEVQRRLAVVGLAGAGRSTRHRHLLVAKNRDDEKFTAIQRKFYAAESTVAKADIDSFLSASSRDEFSQRYIFEHRTSLVGQCHRDIEGPQRARPARRHRLSRRGQHRLVGLLLDDPGGPADRRPKQLRPHQTQALDDVRAGLAEHDRGKLIMACGTGKTVTSLRIAEDLVGQGGSVLFLVPSIQLPLDPAALAVATRVDG